MFEWGAWMDERTASYLAFPEPDGPGVVVVHDGYGFLPHVRRGCDRLAEAGFVALAPDLGNGAAALPRLAESVQALREHPRVIPRRVAAIGYSRGGVLALQLAATGRVDAVVSYYAVLDPAAPPFIPCHVLALFAENDDWDPPDAPLQFLAGLRQRGTAVDDVTYPGSWHSFANADVSAYIEWAAEASWARTISFLRLHLY